MDDQTQRVLDLLGDYPDAYRDYSADAGAGYDVAAFARFVQSLLRNRTDVSGLDPARVDWVPVRETAQDRDPQMSRFAEQLVALGIGPAEFDRLFEELTASLVDRE